MKKIIAILVAVFAITQFSYAQWNSIGGYTYTTTTDNVGIGTSTPGAKLDVVGSVRSQGLFSATNTFFVNNGYAGINNNQTTYGFQLSAGSTNGNMKVDGNIYTDGNIGIGTTSPGALLHLSSGGPSLLLDANSQGTDLKRTYIATSEVNAGDFVIGARNDNNTVKSRNLYITNSGNVGIGTTSPGTKLEVNGGGNIIKVYNNAGEYNNSDILVQNIYGTGSSEVSLTASANQMLIGAQGQTIGDYGGYLNVTSAHPMKFLTNNNERMRIDGSGNVGIGTTSPTVNKLQVTGNTDGLGVAFENTGTGGLIWDIQSTAGSSGYGQGKLAFNLESSGSAGNKMVIQSNGNVGIGTTSPGSLLDLYHTGTGAILRVGGYATGTSNDAGIDLYAVNGSSVPTYARIGLGVNTGSVGSETGYLDFSTINGGTLSEKMRILANGNVGIGTTSPISTLYVKGAGYTSAPDGSYAPLIIEDPTGIAGHNIWAFTTRKGDNTLGIADLFNNKTRLFIDGSGNVGIGTINPDTKLAVQGTIHSTEVKVDVNVPVPDYVFEPDYKLVNLNELKAFVDKNHHLPEIPSATEMAKNGLNLGDMDVKLLKKVEELTIYLIDQNKQLNKQITDQQQVNKSLQEQINYLAKQLTH